jgi:RNA polymerase sigma-70 factor (ECF subfamily)
MSIDSQLRRRFEDAVERHADSMYRVAYRLTGAHDAAAELVQETYLNAWRSLATLSEPDKLRGWMFSILRHQYHKMRARHRPMQRLSEVEISDPGNDPPAAQSTSDELIRTAVLQLDEDHKLPLLLVSMEQMSVEAAAEVLGIPRGTVLSRLHRARRKLREILARNLAEAD